MSKYDLLTTNLKSLGRSRIPMGFHEIERVLGFDMPASSRTHRAWWSNNPSNNVMTKAWLAAGYRTADVDLASGRVVFVKTDDGPASTPPVAPNGSPARHPAWGALKGASKIADGDDLTGPAAPDWGAVYDR